MADWKKVASNRLREIKELRARLEGDRALLAERAVKIVRQEIHSRCLVSIGGDEWRRAFEAMEKKIRGL